MERHHYYFFLAFGLYCGCSKLILDRVQDTISTVVDEQFHIPQAQAYCDGKYDHWDPKITTLPGLYLAAANIVRPFGCTTYNLRLFNLVTSAVNLSLFYYIMDLVYGFSLSRFNVALQALNISLLPTLYFFSHVFYTDTLSLTWLLLFIISVMKRSEMRIFVFAICSILTRQTNCVWTAQFFIHEILKRVILSSRVYGNGYLNLNPRRKTSRMLYQTDPSMLKQAYDWRDLDIAMSYHHDTNLKILYKEPWTFDLLLFTLWLPNALFLIFIFVNGGIVIGDKTAHTMTFNFPQLLYFLLFYGFFGLPFVVSRLKSTLKLMLRNKSWVVIATVLSLAAVHFNTVVHPYLLADNRHYVFYIWSRWFGKYSYAPYATVPVYVFLAFSLIDNLKDQNCISLLISYYVSLVPALCLQRLLELRYFIVPYVTARLRFPKASAWLVVVEFLWYLAINGATFHVFFTKEVLWADFEEPQRIIW